MSMQDTFCMIKPGVTRRSLAGRVISRIEESGLRIIALKMMKPGADLFREHYGEHKDKPFFKDLISYISSDVVVAMVVRGPNAIAHLRRLAGATNPLESPPGTIRGDFALETEENVLHASDSPQSAEREIKLFFKPEEIF